MARHRPRKEEANAWRRRTAVESAEAELKATKDRPASRQEKVLLTVDKITTRTELFQPRGFFSGLHELDMNYVRNKVGREIHIKGELDPVLVIKLGNAWVCVDGHHRLEAYKVNKWKQPITCEWFPGSVRDAVDESIRRNLVVKLEVTQTDRLEEAWRRVVLKWGSKAEIRKLCVVSDGILGKMRRAFAMFTGTDGVAKKLRQSLGKPLEKARWREVHATYLGIETKEFDEHEAAAKLARSIRSRLHDRLSRKPEVTALALAIYDPTLPEKLRPHFEALGEAPQTDDTDEQELGHRMTEAAALRSVRQRLLTAIGTLAGRQPARGGPMHGA